MTIEEKAKAYDKALKKARQLLYIARCNKDEDRIWSLIDMFPELKESDDERIRKEIIAFLTYYHTGQGNSVKYDDGWIAWLEKQIPIDEEKVLIGARKDVALSIMNYLDNNSLGMCLSSMECADLESAVIDSDWSKVYDYMKKKLEKQGEQKPADKVEPKFKIGDWIVYNRNDNSKEIIQIYDIRDGRYYFTDNVHFSWSVKECDEKSHLWSIQDAKDGDVLVNGTILIIVDHLGTFENRPIIYSWYFVDSEKFHGIGPTEPDRWEVKGFIPATKEQRDTLEKAMTDAGYEFDFEKKELKKIELAKNESDEELELSDFEAALFSAFSDGWQQYLNGEEVDVAEWAREHSAELLEAANQNHVAWSEDDENRFNNLIFLVENSNEGKGTKEGFIKFINRLKSLKDRVYPRPKQEWSKEDERMIISISNYLERQKNYQLNKTNIEQCQEWLNSLKQKIDNL